MKTIFFSAIIITFFLFSCNQGHKNNDKHNTNMMDNDSIHMINNNSHKMDRDSIHIMNKQVQMYSCPMHPTIEGEKGDKCSECGMELTEKVK